VAARERDRVNRYGSINARGPATACGEPALENDLCSPAKIDSSNIDSPNQRQGHVLDRRVFATSRLAEFTSKKELTAQTGHAPEHWPLVIVKELIENALDAAEKAGIAPSIALEVET
jgi:hypothetical protein